MSRRTKKESTVSSSNSPSADAVGPGEWLCHTCKSFHFCVCRGALRLCHLGHMPDFVQSNPYVLKGYRPTHLPLSVCLKSLWVWSNESINIWSHLVGFLWFSGCLAYDNLVTLVEMKAHWDDHVVISVTIICFQVCLLCSTGFHLFLCLSERAYQSWLKIDLLGVSVGLLGIYLSGIRYSYYCHPEWHHLYLTFFCILAVVTILAPLHPEYATGRFCRHRLVLYLAVSLYGVVPAVHWLYLETNSVAKEFFPNVVIVYGLTGAAFCFYIFKVPERWRPGQFDFIGSSHQWWHILVLTAFWHWRRAGLDFLQFRLSRPCLGEEWQEVDDTSGRK